MTANEDDFDSWLDKQTNEALQAIDRTHGQARADLYAEDAENADEQAKGTGRRRRSENS